MEPVPKRCPSLDPLFSCCRSHTCLSPATLYLPAMPPAPPAGHSERFQRLWGPLLSPGLPAVQAGGLACPPRTGKSLPSSPVSLGPFPSSLFWVYRYLPGNLGRVSALCPDGAFRSRVCGCGLPVPCSPAGSHACSLADMWAAHSCYFPGSQAHSPSCLDLLLQARDLPALQTFPWARCPSGGAVYATPL